MIAINVRGVFNVIRPALPHLIAAGARPPRHVADLVNISSTGGRVARSGKAVYSLTKFGLGALSESLRQEQLANRVRSASSSRGRRHRTGIPHRGGSPGGHRPDPRRRPNLVISTTRGTDTTDRGAGPGFLRAQPAEQRSTVRGVTNGGGSRVCHDRALKRHGDSPVPS
jgi:NAD(P)-dependent dehydrogenase (short-subunit alcohol dehydrogenase family)